MQDQQTPLILGRINGVYGVKGWVKLLSYARPKENILNYPSLLIQIAGAWSTADIEDRQKRGDRLLLKLSGIDTPEIARSYIGCELAIDPTGLPELAEGQYYWYELIGLQVQNLQEQTLGHVSEIVETGANDVLVIRTDQNEKTKLLIPLIMDTYIKQVDMENGCIYVDWPLEE